MKRVKRDLHGTDRVFIGCIALLVMALLWFTVRLIGDYISGKKICQAEIMLTDMEYNEEFLEEAEQISGIRSVTPIIEIPAKIRADGYTMEISLQGVDLTKLIMTVKESNEVQVGNTPVLILGENSIAMMEDVNGHKISEKKQKELLDRYQEIDWQYCLVGIDKIESSNELEYWESCLIAGILSSPADGIYLPYEQAENYAEKLSGQIPITKILVTVQGEKNHKKIMEYFGID
ncbi:MAG: hypothetical protein HFH93_05720 [Lachnospiraceae bacterium]|nr:hypothetical protein [Clostridiaceae bacterium]MCI9337029.1 hypothetical protein [Lachnospiraceae bacterium]